MTEDVTIENKEDALNWINQHRRNVVRPEFAEELAEPFKDEAENLEVPERPVKEMLRGRREETPATSVSGLTQEIVTSLGMEESKSGMLGHGSHADKIAEKNVEKLRNHFNIEEKE